MCSHFKFDKVWLLSCTYNLLLLLIMILEFKLNICEWINIFNTRKMKTKKAKCIFEYCIKTLKMETNWFHKWYDTRYEPRPPNMLNLVLSASIFDVIIKLEWVQKNFICGNDSFLSHFPCHSFENIFSHIINLSFVGCHFHPITNEPWFGTSKR